MLVPRLFYCIDAFDHADITAEVDKAHAMGISSIILTARQESSALAAKKSCLFHDVNLIIAHAVELTLLVQAHGVTIDFDSKDYNYIHKFGDMPAGIGVAVSSISHLASAFEDGIADYAIINSATAHTNILEDARLMGYDLPIVLSEPRDAEQAESFLSRGIYGFMTSVTDMVPALLAVIDRYPLRD